MYIINVIFKINKISLPFKMSECFWEYCVHVNFAKQKVEDRMAVQIMSQNHLFAVLLYVDKNRDKISKGHLKKTQTWPWT